MTAQRGNFRGVGRSSDRHGFVYVLPEEPFVRLTKDQKRVIDAISYGIVGGRLRHPPSIGQISERAGLLPCEVNAAVEGLQERGWAFCAVGIHWKDEDVVILLGEGLARAAAIADRREDELGGITLDGHHIDVVYEEPLSTRPTWIARGRRNSSDVDAPLEAEAEGSSRASACTALVAAISEKLSLTSASEGLLQSDLRR
jgi:hypothetical protein